MPNRKLNPNEQKWLERNNKYVDRDKVGHEWMFLDDVTEDDFAECTLAEMVGAFSHDVRSVDKMFQLSDLEKKIVELRFIDGMSLRDIAGVVKINTTINGKIVASENPSHVSIKRTIASVVKKLKCVTNVTPGVLVED